MASPVAAGAAVPPPKSNSRLAVGAAVSLPVLAAFQTNFCATGALVVEEYELALNSSIGESPPAVAVAAVAGRLTVPFRVVDPTTSSVLAGAAVPMPTLVPDSAMTELPRVEAPVHIGKYPVVPVPVMVGLVKGSGSGRAADAATADCRSSRVT